MSVLSSIKIPEKVYVGFQGRRAEDEVPLGYLTPYTDDKAGEKRRQSVDNWARGYGNTKTFNSVTLGNEPMVGFKIGRSIRRSGGWNGSGASYVRIEDPRGFELEITIENLVMCMNSCTVRDSEFMIDCVWGRDGNRNILLPINSEPYRNSVKTRSAIAEAIPLRSVKAGDEVELITGERGIYLGGLFPYTCDDGVVEIGTRRSCILINHHGKDVIVGKSVFKVAEITKPTANKWTPAEIEAKTKEISLLGSGHNEDITMYKGIIIWAIGDSFTNGQDTIVDFATGDEVFAATKMNDEYRCHSPRVLTISGKTAHVVESSKNFTPSTYGKSKSFYHGKLVNGAYYGTTSELIGDVYNGSVTSPSLPRSINSRDEIPTGSIDTYRLVKREVTTKTGTVFEFFI